MILKIMFPNTFLGSIKEFSFFFFEKLTFSQHIMMKNLSIMEENIIKDTGNVFRLKKTKLHCN